MDRYQVHHFAHLDACTNLLLAASWVSNPYKSAARVIACNPFDMAKIHNSPWSNNAVTSAMSWTCEVHLPTFLMRSFAVSESFSNMSPRTSWMTFLPFCDRVVEGCTQCRTLLMALVNSNPFCQYFPFANNVQKSFVAHLFMRWRDVSCWDRLFQQMPLFWLDGHVACLGHNTFAWPFHCFQYMAVCYCFSFG